MGYFGASARFPSSGCNWKWLALENGKKLQDLAEDAFRDLLKKHRRPVTLREALKESVRMHPANDLREGL